MAVQNRVTKNERFQRNSDGVDPCIIATLPNCSASQDGQSNRVIKSLNQLTTLLVGMTYTLIISCHNKAIFIHKVTVEAFVLVKNK